jgi:heme exporter protein C
VASPSVNRKPGAQDALFFATVAGASVLFFWTINVIFLEAPEERTMGIVQKIFYFHVPTAFGMYIGAAACFFGSIAYFLRPTDASDALAHAGAEVAVLFGGLLLLTGSLWGAKAWGVYWTWDPRLTTALLQVLIYVSYLVLRAFAGEGDGERRFAAALGIFAAANLPIIHFSVQKWGGQHPMVVTGNGGGLAHPAMRLAFALSSFAFILFAIALVWARARLGIAASRLARAEEDAVDLGLDDRTEA